MTFAGFWHTLTTSRYTRKLEEDNAWLRQRISNLEAALIPRLAVLEARSQVQTPETPAAPSRATTVRICSECQAPHVAEKCPQCGSMKYTLRSAIPTTRKFRSFSSAKKELESMEN